MGFISTFLCVKLRNESANTHNEEQCKIQRKQHSHSVNIPVTTRTLCKMCCSFLNLLKGKICVYPWGAYLIFSSAAGSRESLRLTFGFHLFFWKNRITYTLVVVANLSTSSFCLHYIVNISFLTYLLTLLLPYPRWGAPIVLTSSNHAFAFAENCLYGAKATTFRKY